MKTHNLIYNLIFRIRYIKTGNMRKLWGGFFPVTLEIDQVFSPHPRKTIFEHLSTHGVRTSPISFI